MLATSSDRIFRDMADDFSEPVKRALASRVGNLCSNPECRALTSGPQEDPAKALNIGVGAHITAASPGGARYDADLLPEERSGPSNGIWLCQNCAKLVDNDPPRFTVEILRAWKTAAEAEAKTRIGKTNVAASAVSFNLKVYEHVRIEPIVPRQAEQAEWMIESAVNGCYEIQKLGATGRIEIPSSFIEKVHRFGGNVPALIQLAGRLQWTSIGQRWLLLSDKPTTTDEHGFSRKVDFEYPRRMNYPGALAWCREDRLVQVLGQGRHLFYAEDGKYLRVPGPDIDQILVSDRP
jgi:hypothetical protein